MGLGGVPWVTEALEMGGREEVEEEAKIGVIFSCFSAPLLSSVPRTLEEDGTIAGAADAADAAFAVNNSASANATSIEAILATYDCARTFSAR